MTSFIFWGLGSLELSLPTSELDIVTYKDWPGELGVQGRNLGTCQYVNAERVPSCFHDDCRESVKMRQSL